MLYLLLIKFWITQESKVVFIWYIFKTGVMGRTYFNIRPFFPDDIFTKSALTTDFHQSARINKSKGNAHED